METTKVEGVTLTAFGKTLKKGIPYSGTFEAYENISEVNAAKDFPSDDDVVKMLNDGRKAKARSKAIAAALEAANISKPNPKDPQFILREMVKQLENSGKSYETALKLAENVLGYALDENW